METQLGPLNLRAYLEHYCKKVLREKQKGAETWYCLEECIFDSSHRGGEAAIVVSPVPPFITYHCFHNSCKDRTWKEARKEISGDDSLAPFCENYDRNYISPESTRVIVDQHGTDTGHSMDVQLISGNYDTTHAKHPLNINPDVFFTNLDGKRPLFVVNSVTKYVCSYMGPLRYTAPNFWIYRDGVWKPISRREVGKIISAALKDQKQPARINNTLDTLTFDLNMEDKAWVVDSKYVNLLNGMFNLESFEIEGHSPHFNSQTQLAIHYDPLATCPLFEKTLGGIFRDNPIKVLILQEYIAYCVMQTCRFEKSMIMLGSGANGKSLILKIVEFFLGTENCCAMSLDALNERFGLYALKDKLACISSEVDVKNKANTENFKKIISGDLLTSDRKFDESVTFRTYVKFFFAMNTSPPITDKTYGFARKLLVLNFNRRFEEHERDRTLADRIIASELPGIFNWAMIGAKRLLDQNGFTENDKVTKETKVFLASMNPVLVYIEEKCIMGDEFSTVTEELFEEYKKWCSIALYSAMSHGKFNEQIMAQKGVRKTRRYNPDGSRTWVFKGIGLRKQWSGYPGLSDRDQEAAD